MTKIIMCAKYFIVVVIVLWLFLYLLAFILLEYRLHMLNMAGAPLSVNEWQAQARKVLPPSPNPDAVRIVAFFNDLSKWQMETLLPKENTVLDVWGDWEDDLFQGNWEQEQLHEVNSILHSNQEILSQAVMIATYQPLYWSEYAQLFDKEALSSYDMECTFKAREILKLMILKSLASLEMGEIAAAIDELNSAFGLIKQFEATPTFIINILATYSSYQLAYEQAALFLLDEKILPNQLSDIDKILAKYFPEVDLAYAYKLEVLFTYEGFQKQFNSGDYTHLDYVPQLKFLTPIAGFAIRPYIQYDYSEALKRVTTAIELLETYNLDSLENFVKMETALKGMDHTDDLFITPEAALQFKKINVRVTFIRELLNCGIALKKFKLINTTYPKSLDELVPDYLNIVTLDVFSGLPLQYELSGEGFRLWSVGENLLDDNELPKNVQRQPLYVKKDIAVQVSH